MANRAHRPRGGMEEFPTLQPPAPPPDDSRFTTLPGPGRGARNGMEEFPTLQGPQRPPDDAYTGLKPPRDAAGRNAEQIAPAGRRAAAT